MAPQHLSSDLQSGIRGRGNLILELFEQQSEGRPRRPRFVTCGLVRRTEPYIRNLCSRSTAVLSVVHHAACSLEGARSVLARFAFTRAADDAPSSDNP
jgi:hypothetical protein